MLGSSSGPDEQYIASDQTWRRQHHRSCPGAQERKDAAENVVERTEREMTDHTKEIGQFSRQYKDNEINVQLTKQKLIVQLLQRKV